MYESQFFLDIEAGEIGNMYARIDIACEFCYVSIGFRYMLTSIISG